MTFHYYEINSKIIRPIIPILLKSPSKIMLYSGIIDSGADYCTFSLDTAKVLDIKLESKDKVKIAGVGKEKITGYRNKIEMRIGDKTYATKVIFADMSDFGYGILGQLGFFDHFDVTLRYYKQEIEIEPIKLVN